MQRVVSQLRSRRLDGAYTLELIEALPADGETLAPPLLFVHGAYTGAWCWQEHFLPYFAQRGYHAAAVSLRGHGESTGHAGLWWFTLEDYLDDLQCAVAALPRPPILIGHSMGGMVVQKYIERQAAPAIALLASVPPSGLTGAIGWILLRDPLLWQQLQYLQWLGPDWVGVEGARRALFSQDLPDSLVAYYGNQSQVESPLALLDMTGINLPNPLRRPKLPALVVGGQDDALIPPWAIQETANAFATEALMLPDLAHAMMLDTRWSAVADAIIAWLERLSVEAA